MNKPQRAILLVAACSFALMGLFPPWLVTATCRTNPGVSPMTTSGEYACLLSPPEGYGDSDWSYSFRVDLARLAVQAGVVATISAAILLAVRQRRQVAPNSAAPLSEELPLSQPPEPPSSAAAAPHSPSALPPPSSEAIRSAPR